MKLSAHIGRKPGLSKPQLKQSGLRCYAGLGAVLLGFLVSGQALAIVNGNLSYVYNFNQADGGAESESANWLGSVGLNTFLWKPWFATFSGSGTVSTLATETQSTSTDAEFVSGHANLGLFPKSRFPFTYSYSARKDHIDVFDAADDKISGVGGNFRTEDQRAQQSFLFGGNRFDMFHRELVRGNNIYGTMTDNTIGGSLKTRLPNHNFYLDASETEQKQSLIEKKSVNELINGTYTYTPNSEFYIKALGNKTKVNNDTPLGNGSFRSNSSTDVNQAAGVFYWRPEYKRFSMNGGARFNKRNSSLLDEGQINTQRSVAMNGALNYRFSRKVKSTVAGNWSDLKSTTQDIGNMGGQAGVNYYSDRLLLGRSFPMLDGVSYFWNWDVTGRGELQRFETTLEAQERTLGAGVGHNASRSWNTGNRSNLRVNLAQNVRANLISQFEDELGSRKGDEADGIPAFAKDFVSEGVRNDESVLLNNSATLAWTEDQRKGQFYIQMTSYDSRSLTDDFDSQIINFQLSKSSPISRMSSWGGHVSAQATRRHTAETSDDNFLKTASGTLNYKHQRLFGIYKLRFRMRARLDYASLSNRGGGDRQQRELDLRTSYQVGLLGTSFSARKIWNDSGLGALNAVFSVTRSF
ncbi:MAG: hypothetical protein OEZ47_07460 [Gammaproteobacteria bacterium]|nr:hypothetical protein [Gammaproteobacteria bacterium]